MTAQLRRTGTTRAEAALRRQKAHTFMTGGLIFVDSRDGTPWKPSSGRTASPL